MDGSTLFWTSGTWVFFLAQIMVVLFVVYLYRHLGRKEKEAIQKQNKDDKLKETLK